MTHQPDDRDQAWAEQQQEHLSVLDEEALTANTDEDDDRVADEDAGPLTGQPEAPSPRDRGEPRDRGSSL